MEEYIFLFDFDGTLIKSTNTVLTLWKNLAQEFGFLVTKARLRKKLSSDWQTMLKKEFRQDWKEHLLLLKRHFDWYQEQLKTKPLIPELVSFLRTHRFGIISSSFQTIIQHKIKEYALAPEFVYTSDSLHSSSKERLLAHAIKKNKLDVKRCVYVCDMKQDISGAKAHNIKTIGVLWGFHTKNMLKNADMLAHTPTQLISMLRRVQQS